MILPPDGVGNAAFSESTDGDLRNDRSNRVSAATTLGISSDWSVVDQVHGSDVLEVSSPGVAGEADAIWTSIPDLPLAIFTADCFGVVIAAPTAIGVAHAGWRGARAGVVRNLRKELGSHGHEPVRALIGPGIGACCFEVGDDVATQFPRERAQTTWGSMSVDIAGHIVSQLDGLETWHAGGCTRHEPGWFSHRATRTAERMATMGWL